MDSFFSRFFSFFSVFLFFQCFFRFFSLWFISDGVENHSFWRSQLVIYYWVFMGFDNGWVRVQKQRIVGLKMLEQKAAFRLIGFIARKKVTKNFELVWITSLIFYDDLTWFITLVILWFLKFFLEIGFPEIKDNFSLAWFNSGFKSNSSCQKLVRLVF